MSIELYMSYGTRGSRVLWFMLEAGIEHSLHIITMNKGEHKTPEYKAKFPHGKVPGMKIGDLSFFESLAMIFHLADLHDKTGSRLRYA